MSERLNHQQAAELLRCSPQTLYWRVQRGLPPTRYGKRRKYYYLRAEVEQAAALLRPVGPLRRIVSQERIYMNAPPHVHKSMRKVMWQIVLECRHEVLLAPRKHAQYKDGRSMRCPQCVEAADQDVRMVRHKPTPQEVTHKRAMDVYASRTRLDDEDPLFP